MTASLASFWTSPPSVPASSPLSEDPNSAMLPCPTPQDREALLAQLQQAQQRLRESSRVEAEEEATRSRGAETSRPEEGNIPAAGSRGVETSRPEEGNTPATDSSEPQQEPQQEPQRETRNRRRRSRFTGGLNQTPAANPGANPESSSQPLDESSSRFSLSQADLDRFPAPPPEELLADKDVVDFLLLNILPEFRDLPKDKRRDKRKNIRDKAGTYDVQGGRLIRFRQIKRKLNEEGGQAVVKLLVLSAEQRDQVLKWVHDDGGHPAFAVTRQRIINRFWWKTQGEDIKNYVRDCEHCKEVAAQRETQDRRLMLRSAAEVRVAAPVNPLDWLRRGEPVQQKRAVWLDCDPGHDDALAIILAAFTPSLELLGVSTVASNQSLGKVTVNAQRVLALVQREDIGVVPGAAKPLLRPMRTCPEIHGASGLDGAQLPQPTAALLPGKAVNVMFDAISKRFRNPEHSSRKVALVATGALTNVALLLSVYPEVKDLIEITIMGGCLGVGNTGPVTEFNIQCDPEAASIVFESGVPLTMIPLEVTHTANVSPAVLSAIRTPSPTPFRETICHLLDFFKKTYREVFNKEYPPLHDPCAVAYVIAPEIFKVDLLRVDVETRSELSAGQTVVDVWKQTDRPPNVHVARKMDVKAFWSSMLQALNKADARIKAVQELRLQGNCMDILQ